MLSLKIERELSKDEILYLYLNQIYLGDGNYGIGAAARSYFCEGSLRADTARSGAVGRAAESAEPLLARRAMPRAR